MLDTILAILTHFVVPIIIIGIILFVILNSFTIAKGDEIITLERRWFGAQMPDGRTVALSNEVGIQARILGPGFHWLIPFIYKTTKHKFIVIEKNMIGVVRAITGAPIPTGEVMAKKISCDLFQDGEAFLKNGGEKGPQIAFLKTGFYRINTILFKIEKRRIVEIEGGKIGLIEAADGERIPEGRLLAKKIDGHSNFFDGQAFIANGGERGRQLDVLMPGKYPINTMLFKIIEVVDWTNVQADQVGIVTVKEGLPIVDPTKIAAEELGLDVHNNFQDSAAFLNAKGQKGLQIPVLRAGNYAINPWFAAVEKVEMTRVDIGFCGVVTSFVGEEGEDVSGEDVNAKIVENGKKGIWANPLEPGKHPINTKICKVDIVPTTQILLNWANNQSSAHELDSNLSTITLRTADAFSVNMDVSVIIHIPMKNAPKVIANLGSVKNMISQVLEPAISSHFRNAAQYIKALDLYTERRELQAKAKAHIDAVLKVHHIDSKETLIADVVLPGELTKTVTDRQIAEQEKATYKTQKDAQIERRGLENETAQANMQTKVVESERNVEIEKNIADGKIKSAEGLKKAAILSAEGTSEATKLNAAANAEATKLTAGANAEATKLNAAADKEKGMAEAAVILEKGKSTAEAYKLEVAAMGQENFGRINSLKEVKELKLKLVPDVLIMGGGSEGGSMENFFKLSLLEKVTGKDFLAIAQEATKKEVEKTS